MNLTTADIKVIYDALLVHANMLKIGDFFEIEDGETEEEAYARSRRELLAEEHRIAAALDKVTAAINAIAADLERSA